MITRRTATAGLAAALTAPSWGAWGQGFWGQGFWGQGSSAAPAPSGETTAIFGPGIIPVLAARPKPMRLRPDAAQEADVWAFNGRLDRPLRIKHGKELHFVFANETPLPLSFHFQGVRGPNAIDGVGGLTQEPIAPGKTQEIRFTPPDAGTFLIRPCILGGSAEPLERGLSSLLIVEEAEPLEVDDDIPVLIDDWNLTENGALTPFRKAVLPAPAGRLGNWLTVNGKPTPLPIEAAPGARLRLRLANACNARIVQLRFGRLAATVISVDGQPTNAFEPLQATLSLAPGSRYDVLVDAPPEAGGIDAVSAGFGRGLPFVDLVEIVTRGDRRPPRPKTSGLAANPHLPQAIRLEEAVRKDVEIKGDPAAPGAPWTINGAAGNPSAPLLTVRRGTPVVLALTNRTRLVQPLHLHGHAFRVLHALDDGWEPYFLDTVQVPENRTARIAFVADNPGKWLLASTVMERFDAGLWTWIEVT